MLKEVIKRDGKHSKFMCNKIKLAILKANAEVPVNARISDYDLDDILDEIKSIKESVIHIEVIQDIIENCLMQKHYFELAKKYITYRYIRGLGRDISEAELSILGILRGTNLDVIDENSNKNSYTNSTQRDLMAGEVSKSIAKKLLLPKEIEDADENMVLHWHDKDYTAQKMINCCLINIKNILDFGTVLSGYLIESPKSFRTACTIVTQVIANIASNQYGGQSVNLKHLGKYVQITREKFMIENRNSWDKIGLKYTEEQLQQFVEDKIAYEIEQGIQTIQYQAITLQTTNGQLLIK